MPIPAVKSITDASGSARGQSSDPSSRCATSTSAAGAPTSAPMWSGTASAKAYAVATRHFIALAPSFSLATSAASSASITSSSTLAYTSVSVALDHTVNIPPAHSAPASAIGHERVTRSSTSASTPPAAAVHVAEKRFVASAVLANGIASAHARASIT